MTIQTLLRAGGAKIPADIIIHNAKLVNVHSSEIYEAGVAIYGEHIVATGDVSGYEGKDTEFIDAKGSYLVPGLIDGHLHIECSKLSMTRFAELVLPHGTTSIISGLDQYLVIAGLEGIDEVIKEINSTLLKVFWGLPFVTPYTLPTSSVGFNVCGKTHQELQSCSHVFGVWETVSEFLENEHPEVLQALEEARKNRLPIFGCAPMTQGKRLNAILSAGVRLDHESYSPEEALEKVRKGMFVLLRESSISHFLEENIKIVTEHNPRLSRRISFCTDDVTPSEILQHGHMDKLVRMAISCGVDPITAIQMGSLNSAEAYRIDHLVGSIAPGKIADILFVDDLREFKIHSVIAKGKYCISPIKQYKPIPPSRSPLLLKKPQISKITQEEISFVSKSKKVEVLSMEVDRNIPFVRKQKNAILEVKDGRICSDVEQDVLHAVVVERFGGESIARAFVSGWGIKYGAMASSKAPDDNNIVCIGENTKDMAFAINFLAENGGGQVIVRDKKVEAFLPLPICGIVCDESPEFIAEKEKEMLQILRNWGSNLPDPMFFMCCLQITAIPDFALTNRGAIDVRKQEVFDPILKEFE